MRVVHVVTLVSQDGAYGGPTAVATQQVRELRLRGHDVVLLAGCLANGPVQGQLGDIPLRAVGVRRWLPAGKFAGLLSLPLLRELWRAIGTSDVVHVHYARDLITVAAGLIARMRKRPLVLQTHGMIALDTRLVARVLDRLAVRATLRRAERVLYLTERELLQLRDVGGIAVPVGQLDNGVHSCETLPPAVEGRATTILFAARLHPKKRVMTFLHAARDILIQFPDARFLVAGPDEGDLKDVLDFIDQLNLGSAIRYLGPVPPSEMPRLFRTSDIYVLPSVDEQFPMSVLEAMSLGVPTIITTRCGLADRVARQGAALVVEPEADALREGIAVLLADEPKRTALGARGNEFVRDELSIEHVTDALEAVYAQACKVPRAAFRRGTHD